jgi:hypothetical protein
MLTLPEHLMIFPFFVKVHAASALFFVTFVFNSVYLFCPCYFYCLFVCTLSIAFLTCDFLDLIISSACCFGIHLPMFLGTFIV